MKQTAGVYDLIPEIDVVQLAELWREFDRVTALIEAALEYSHQPADNIREIMSEVAAGNAHILEIKIMGQLRGVAVVQRSDTVNGPYLNVWTLGGTDLDDWVGDLNDFLTGWAKIRGLEGVMCGGRPGWRKVLKRLGWQEQAVIMTRAVQ